MRRSTRTRAITLAEYLSSEAGRSEPDWAQITKDAAELSAIARVEVDVGDGRRDPPPGPPREPQAGLAPPGHLLTVAQVAELVGVSEHTIRRHIRAGELAAYRVGGGPLRVRSEDLEAYVTARPATGS